MANKGLLTEGTKVVQLYFPNYSKLVYAEWDIAGPAAAADAGGE